MKLLGFTGKMGSGKSTAIECLKEIQRLPVINIKFAQPLYDMQEMIYRRISTVYEKPAGFIKDRKLLQFLGTEWGRNTIRETLWLDIWSQSARQYENKNAIVVCDDVRFDNEAKLIKSLGGSIVLIKSTETDNRIDTRTGIANHVSEVGVDLNLVDYIVENNDTIDDLRGSILDVANLTGVK